MAFPPEGADTRELSALELMMEHADQNHIPVQGAPKPKKRKQQTKFDARDVLREMGYDDADFEPAGTVFVGPGSRAKNREARELRNNPPRQQEVKPVQQETVAPTSRPDAKLIENALENVFSANAGQSDVIVDALKDNQTISKETTKVLKDWMDWEKSRAFQEDNKARKNDAAPTPLVNEPKSAQENSNDGGGLEDLLDGNDRGRRYGRDRNGRRNRNGRDSGGRRRRRGPRPGGRRFPKIRGKLGAILGLGAAAIGVGGAVWAGSEAKQESSETLYNEGQDPYANPKPTAVPTENARATPDAAKSTVDAVDSKIDTGMTTAQKDAAVELGSAGGYALAGAKKIPVLGSAISLASGAYDANKIREDTTLTDREKEIEYSKTAGGTAGGMGGAVAGAWIGGAIGSVIPVAGTAAGAALGGVIGNILGDYFGNSIGEYVATKITKETDATLDEADKERQKRLDEYDKDTQDALGANKSMPIVTPYNMMGGGPIMNQGGGYGNYGVPYKPGQAKPRLTTAQEEQFAAKAIAAGGLGGVSEQFESGGRGVSTVSSGRGDAGGVSYGKHQLATNNGSMANFMQSKEGQQFADQFGGAAPGSAEFSAKYKQVAAANPEAFDKAQSDYITRTHYAPLAAKTQKDLGVDLTKRGKAVQEMLYSTSVQYGGGTGVVSRALDGKNLDAMTDSQIVEAVQDDKQKNVDRDFRSSDAATRASVATRTQDEKAVLLKVREAEVKKQLADAVNPNIGKPDADAALDAKIAQKFPDLPKGKGDYSNTQVDAQPVPDLTAAGPKGTFTHKEYQMPQSDAIQPIQKPQVEPERQPLVQIPEPAPVQTDTAQSGGKSDKPKATGVVKPQQSSGSMSTAAQQPSLDSMPLFVDDPLMQMINLGYI